jgi:trehalose-6-phosphate synthase
MVFSKIYTAFLINYFLHAPAPPSSFFKTTKDEEKELKGLGVGRN